MQDQTRQDTGLCCTTIKLLRSDGDYKPSLISLKLLDSHSILRYVPL